VKEIHKLYDSWHVNVNRLHDINLARHTAIMAKDWDLSGKLKIEFDTLDPIVYEQYLSLTKHK